MAPISVVFRVQLIPPHITAKDLRLAFHLDAAHQSGIEIAEDSLVLLPSCTERSTQTALVQFTPTYPDFLKKLAAGTTQTYTLKVPSWKTSLAIDTNFLGLTQLSPVPQNKATSDIVAVTGLAGHAYGSWRDKTTKNMWLRDFLPKRFPKSRIMIYGYDSNLQNGGIHKMIDYQRDFLQELQIARSSKDERTRPIVFLGHSFGGIIIAQDLEDDIQARSIYDHTCGILFFATPHRGIVMDDVIAALNKKSDKERIRLLESLNPALKLSIELERFINISPRIKISSFYETAKTNAIVLGKDGTLSPSGKPRVRLPADSALLQLPMNREKIHTAVGNHSDIVKFESEANRTYKVVCNDLKQFLPAAGISTKTLPGNSTYTDETLYTRISKTTPKRNPPMAHKMAAVVVPKTPTANNAPHRNPVSASPKRPDNPEKNIPATPKTRLLRRSLQKSLGLPLKHILGLLPIKNPANTSK